MFILKRNRQADRVIMQRHHQIVGKSLKFQLPSLSRKIQMAGVMTLGKVKTLEMLQWVIRSQVLKMDAVHRLDVGGFGNGNIHIAKLKI